MENIGLALFFEFFVSRLQLSPLTYKKRTRPILSNGEAPSSVCVTRVLLYCKAQHVKMIDSCWGLRKIFFWVFQLENASPLFTLYPSHNLLIIYSHYLSFRHVEPCSIVGHVSHTSEPSIWPCSPRVSHSSVVRASNRYFGRSWVRLSLGAQKNLFLSISTWQRFSVICTLSKSQSTYHLFDQFSSNTDESHNSLMTYMC